MRAAPRASAAVVDPSPKELLLVGEVVERARVSRWTLWRLSKANRFPAPMQIGFKRIAWRATEVDAWIAGTWRAPIPLAA